MNTSTNANETPVRAYLGLSPDSFVENAKTLDQLGWHPVPVNCAKALYASGVTGRHGVDVRDEDTFRRWADLWATDGLNLGVRMPVGVIGVDVDCYDGKPGAATLAEYEQRWGALPATWSVTARDDGSRKLFFRVPDGWEGAGVLGPGAEILQRHHRYAVAPPSVHPAGIVKAFAPDGHDCGTLPPPGELPVLPAAWCDGLHRDAVDTRKGSPQDAERLEAGFRDGPMALPVQHHVNEVLTALAEKSNRFDRMRDAVLALARLGAMGQRGVNAALRMIEAEYIDAVANKRGRAEASAEFARAMAGGLQIVAADPLPDLYTGDTFGPDGLARPESPWHPLATWQPIDEHEDGVQLWVRVPPGRSEELAREKRERFVVVSAAELAGPIPPMRWLIKGVWALNSFGPLGGEKKTLKSYNLLSMAVAVASGEPFYGEFDVASPGAVLYLAGEGGRDEHQRRLQTVARAYGVPLEDLPLHTMFDTAGLDDPEFVAALTDCLDRLQPRLVVLDPLYAFHPSGIEAQNLYERGRMLADFNARVGNETSLIIADHFNKTGRNDLDLDSIAQAGMGQWADSWILQRHREPPDQDAGVFRLAVEFGSRRWGGRQWNLDWRLPSADAMERGEVGEVSWSVERASDTDGGGASPRDKTAERVMQVLRDEPEFSLTESGLIKAVGGNKATTSAVVRRLHAKGLIQAKRAKYGESNGIEKERTRYGLPESGVVVPGLGGER